MVLNLCWFLGLIPSVNQIEYHPYWHEDEFVKYCQSLNITVNSYAPLSCPDYAPHAKGWKHSALQEPIIMNIAQKYNRTPAQVWKFSFRDIFCFKRD